MAHLMQEAILICWLSKTGNNHPSASVCRYAMLGGICHAKITFSLLI